MTSFMNDPEGTDKFSLGITYKCYIIQVCVRVRLSSVVCSKAKVGAYATVSPFSGDLLGDSRMSNVLDKSFIHRLYPKLAYGSINYITQ